VRAARPPSLGRWLTQQPNGRLKVNTAKVKAEQRLDGKYLIATSDPHLSAEDAALGYKNLAEAERGFRDLKSTLLLRPVFHRLKHRIRAHVLLCWLALLLTRIAERSAGLSWRNINRQLGRITQVTLAGPAGTVTQTTPDQLRTEGHLPGTIHPTAGPDHRLRPPPEHPSNARAGVGTRPTQHLPAFAQVNPPIPTPV
jgi:hypothetical protein